jgi:hypothetical protein
MLLGYKRNLKTINIDNANLDDFFNEYSRKVDRVF